LGKGGAQAWTSRKRLDKKYTRFKVRQPKEGSNTIREGKEGKKKEGEGGEELQWERGKKQTGSTLVGSSKGDT